MTRTATILAAFLTSALATLPIATADVTPDGYGSVTYCQEAGGPRGACMHVVIVSSVTGCALEKNGTYTCGVDSSLRASMEGHPACAHVESRLIDAFWCSVLPTPVSQGAGRTEGHHVFYDVPLDGMTVTETVKACLDVGSVGVRCTSFLVRLHVSPAGSPTDLI